MEPQEEHNEAEKGKRNMEKLFDLQVFAQENTQTTGGLSAEMKTYYGMELLDNAKPQLVHNQFAATKPLPTGGGKTVEWRKFGSFDKALTPLTEGVTPDGSGISVSYITKELAQYGDYTTVSDMLDLTAIDDVVLEITDRHGANMGLTLDTVTRNEIQQGKQVLYAPAIGADGSKTEVTARGALTAACRLTSEMVAKAATQLKKMNAPTFDGKYVCILTPVWPSICGRTRRGSLHISMPLPRSCSPARSVSCTECVLWRPRRQRSSGVAIWLRTAAPCWSTARWRITPWWPLTAAPWRRALWRAGMCCWAVSAAVWLATPAAA